MTSRFSRRLVVPLAAALAAGCSEARRAEEEPTARPTMLAKAAAKARALTEASEQAAAEPMAVSEEGSKTVEASAYEPPFPERLDLFEPPQQAARVTRQTTGDSAESVVLLGFANLDRPQVLLSIDNLVRPLASGEEAAGVKVISIAPPRAVLQRGRSRWTASIE